MYIEFEVNDEKFTVMEHYKGGKYFWFSGEAEGELFDAPCEAQQDAIKTVIEHEEYLRQAEEDARNEAVYGSYEKQVYSQWAGSR